MWFATSAARAFAALLVGAVLVASASPARAAASLREAERILEQETGQEARRYSTRDFGRERYPGARSVIVEDARAAELLAAVRAKLPSGLVAFLGTQATLDDGSRATVELVVGHGASQFDILRIAATDGINHGKETEDLIAVLQDWDRRFGIDIHAALTDTIQVTLKSKPAD